MLFSLHFFLHRTCFRPSVRIACATLILLLATHSRSSANSQYLSGHDARLQTSLPANPATPDESPANTLYIGSLNAEPLVINAAFATHHPDIKTVPASVADAAPGEVPPSQPANKNRTPDWNGVYRDTGLVFGGQIAAAALTYVMPESFSSWTPEQKKSGLKKYSHNFMNPVLDKDKFYVNYLLHPYWGATYYIRARERGLDQTSSLLYSTLLSAMYEFGVECVAEKPSIQDLLITPGLGTLLGAYIFEPLRESIKSKQELSWYDHTALILTDPLGLFSLGIEKIFGIKSTIMVDYSNPQIQNRTNGTAVAAKSSRIGLVMQVPLE